MAQHAAQIDDRFHGGERHRLVGVDGVGLELRRAGVDEDDHGGDGSPREPIAERRPALVSQVEGMADSHADDADRGQDQPALRVAVGGRGTLSGAVVGALATNLLYNFFTSERDLILFTWKAQYWQFLLGGLFIGVVLVFPNGLVRLVPTIQERFAKTWPRKFGTN